MRILIVHNEYGAFSGEEALGTWTFRIEDLGSGDRGQLIAWALDLLYDDGNPAITVTGGGIGTDIPAFGRSNFTATIADTGPITSVRLRTSIIRTIVSDMSLYLTSPAGTRIVLSSGNGGSGSNMVDTVFDDSAGDRALQRDPQVSGPLAPERPHAEVRQRLSQDARRQVR